MGGSCSLGAARGGCSRILLGHLPAGALYRPQSPSGDAFPHATPSVKEQGTPRKADMMLPIDRAVVNRPEGDQEGHVPDMRGLEKDLGRRQARRKEDYRTALTALRSSASPKMPSFSSPRPALAGRTVFDAAAFTWCSFRMASAGGRHCWTKCWEDCGCRKYPRFCSRRQPARDQTRMPGNSANNLSVRCRSSFPAQLRRVSKARIRCPNAPLGSTIPGT